MTVTKLLWPLFLKDDNLVLWKNGVFCWTKCIIAKYNLQTDFWKAERIYLWRYFEV